MRRFLNLLGRFGKLAACFGLLMCVPAAVSYYYDDGHATVYLLSGGCVSGGGIICAIICAQFRRPHFSLRDGFLLVGLIWTILPALAALPFVFILSEITFTRSYFEAASGLTATGATVLSGLDNLPPSLNFWRGEISWLGGMGLIVLVVAIMPLLLSGSGTLMQTELPGPDKESRLTPQVAQTAKSLWGVYTILTAACGLAYYIAGMTAFDAIMHAFTTLALGGFSSHDASYAYFNSPAIELVAMFFMTLAGINFVVHILACGRRNPRPRLYWQNQECRAYFIALLLAVFVIVVYLRLAEVYPTWLQSLRYGAFNTISIITTTGFSNTDYGTWPLFAPILMLILANFVSCGGSTGGGIKMRRTLILIHQMEPESQKNLHPRASFHNRAAANMSEQNIISILFFIIAYSATAVGLMLILTATGMDLLTATSAAIATISNTGPGLGDVGPAANYGWLSPVQTWLCSFAMLIGRLELLSLIILLRKSFWEY